MPGDIRRRILDLILQDPGIDRHALARKAERTPTTMSYHLGILQRERLIEKRSFQGVTGYFAVDGHDVTPLALKAESAQRVMAVVQDFPGCDITELTRRSGLPRSTATYHMRRLQAAGAVVVTYEPMLRIWPRE